MPPCTTGCKVLTLPPRISGAPEISETSFTSSPESLRLLAVPPLATKVKPSSCKFFPNSMSPVLSETDKSAACSKQLQKLTCESC